MKSAGKARSNGLYRHIRTSKEIIRNLLNDYGKYIFFQWQFLPEIPFVYFCTIEPDKFYMIQGQACLLLPYHFAR